MFTVCNVWALRKNSVYRHYLAVTGSVTGSDNIVRELRRCKDFKKINSKTAKMSRIRIRIRTKIFTDQQHCFKLVQFVVDYDTHHMYIWYLFSYKALESVTAALFSISLDISYCIVDLDPDLNKHPHQMLEPGSLLAIWERKKKDGENSIRIDTPRRLY